METSKDFIIITNKEDLKSVIVDILKEWQHQYNDNAILTPEEVMGILGISNTTLWRLEKEQVLVPIRLSNGVRVKRYRKRDVDKLFDK